MGNSYFPSGNGSVTGGDKAWGAWATVFTPTIELCGFWMCLNSDNSGTPYGAFNLFIGSGTPGTPTISNGCFDGGASGMVFFPLHVPANTPIQIQTYNLNSTTDSVTAYIVGKPSNGKVGYSTCQALGASTSSNFTAVTTTATQFGTTLANPVKAISILGGNGASYPLGGMFTLSIGSTGATDVISNISTGGNDAYTSTPSFFEVDLPPSQAIWLTSSATGFRAVMYLFY